jgi:ABC-type transport system involved in multi-copper enzyme maturation permease subunit
MANLLSAEWKKVIRNYRLTGFLVWVFPVGIGAFYVLMLVSVLIDRRIAEGMLTTGFNNWTENALGIWTWINNYPLNILGRMLPLAFMSTVFASEYQWGMWKNLVPRARRPALIFSKFVVLVTVLMISLITTSIVSAVGLWLGHLAVGAAYGPRVTSAVLGDFLPTYLQQVGISLVSLVILAGGAAIAAILTRSILGGLLIGLGFSVIDPLTLVGLSLMAKILDNPGLINAYRVMPSYNQLNAQAWMQLHMAYLPGPGFTHPPSLAFSLVVLLVWAVGLVLLAIYAFSRQDISS